MFSTHVKLAAGVAAVALLAACGNDDTNGADGAAAGYPERDITMIFPFAAGSPGDVNARALAAEAERFLDAGVQVVNRPGAAGTIGAAEVVQAEPDGYTIGFVPIAPMTVQPQRTDLPYSSPEDYEGVMGATLIAEALSVRADAPWDTLDDFLADAQTEGLTVATSGAGTILDIDTKLLALEAESKFETVAFDGEQQLLAAMLGGTTDAAVSGVSAAQPFVDSGDARVLGVFAEESVPTMPDVPTMPELGHDITFGVNNFIIAPKGTDEAIIEALHEAFHQAWETEEYQTFLEENGFIPQYMPPEELEAFLAEQYEAYGEVVEQLGL